MDSSFDDEDYSVHDSEGSYESDYYDSSDSSDDSNDLDDSDEELDGLQIRSNAVGLLLEDAYDLPSRILTDTTYLEARIGKDIQGIPWEKTITTRENYRRNRVRFFYDQRNVPLSEETTDEEFNQTEKGGNYYEFNLNTRIVKPTCTHPQLRNLISATSKHDVYINSKYSVLHWSLLSQKPSNVLNFLIQAMPAEEHLGNHHPIKISALAVKENLLVAGGFGGELSCKCLDRREVSFCDWNTKESDSMTTAIDIYDRLSGEVHFIASSRNCGVREFDARTFQLLNHFSFPWPVNHISMSPDRQLMTVVGSHPTGLLVDSYSGQTVCTLVGHLDYSFASAWHPEGRILATGNQDKTCRVWDLRNLSSPISVLKGNLGAIRSIRFSSDGQFMAVAESADFVHVYSTKDDYKREQEIDFFGEISGISLSPDDESLFIGVWDETYSSLLHYQRKHAYYGYLDSVV